MAQEIVESSLNFQSIILLLQQSLGNLQFHRWEILAVFNLLQAICIPIRLLTLIASRSMKERYKQRQRKKQLQASLETQITLK